MAWNYDDEEINGIVDANLKDSPPNPPAVNTAATIRTLLKSFWAAIRGQVSGAVLVVDQAIAAMQTGINTQLTTTLTTVETRVASAEAKVNSIYTTFSLADRLGVYNATTGVATISETAVNETLVAAPSKTKGKYFDVVVAGTNSVTGISQDWQIGDKIISATTKWDRIPFAIGDGTLVATKFQSTLQKAIPGAVEVVNESFPILMTPSGRMLMWHFLNGVIHGKFDLSLSDIPYEKLPDSVKNGLVNLEDVTYTDILPIAMDTNKRMLIYGKKDGSVYIPKLYIKGKSITEAQLADSVMARFPSDGFKSANETNFYDVEIIDDELLRGVEIEIPIKTSALIGYPFQQFPNAKTKILKGLNDTGTDLLFRQTCGLVIRGRQYKGDFNPTASGFVGTSFKGTYGNSATGTWGAFPTGVAGDCWVIDNGNVSTSRTVNGLTFKNGDMLVVTSTGYGIQPGPGDGTYSSKQGDFWNITAAGYFGGIYYPANSRIYQLGQQSNSGPKYLKYAVSKPGELYTMGECNASFAPTSQRDGDLYIFSAAATTQGLTGSIGDFLIYRGGWGISSGQSVSVPNGKSFFLACQNANEWSVRRSDKSALEVSVKAYGHRTTVRRKNKFDLALFSDSMFGVGVGAKILTLTGRTGTTKSYGGATSYEVLSMVKDFILTNDLYAGSVFAFWHGQNNGSDLVQIKDAAHRMAALVGSYEARFAFWSVLGARTVSWNGTRFVASIQEDPFNGTGFVLEVEKFYEAAFPRQYYSPRKALLEAAALRTNVPDLLSPGQTEAQTAATYGILPFSYWFEFSGKPFTASNLVFVDYKSTAGLPTDGVDFNYYIRTGGGVVGNIIVKVAGVWTEYTWDSIHLSSEGSDAAASKFKDFLTLHNI